MNSNEHRAGKWLIGLCAGLGLLAGGVVIAQTATPPPAATATAVAAPHSHVHGGPGAEPGGPPATGRDPRGGGAMGPGMMGGGQGMGMGMGMGMMGGMGMGPGMMGGMCPMMGSAGAKVEVKKVPKGVSITITADDVRAVARIQKMGEAMRLMHEATSE